MALVALLACFVIPTVFGAALLVACRLTGERVATVALGAALGLAAFTTVGYLVSLLIPPTVWLPLALLLLTGGAAAALLARADVRAAWQALELDRVGIVVGVVALGLALPVATKELITAANGWSTGIVSAYGDVALHTALAGQFAVRHGFPPENPIFAGNPLAYPFLPDFFDGLLLCAGNNIPDALNFSALLQMALVLLLAYVAGRDLSGMKGAGIVAALLLAFGGATFGFIHLPDALHGVSNLKELAARWPNADLTGSGGDTNGYHFINPWTNTLLAQRALLFGLPMALTLIMLQLAWRKEGAGMRRGYFVAGALAGMLPLFHPHTVLALLPFEVILFLSELYAAKASAERFSVVRAWASFTTGALLVGAPELLYFMTIGAVAHQDITFHAWWQADQMSPLLYWFKNAGFLLPLTLLGFFLPAPRAAKLVAGAGLTVFAAANTWQFARWTWDNYKLLLYWLVLTLPLIAWVLNAALKKGSLWRIGTCALIGVQMIGGFLDYLRVATIGEEYGEWDADAVKIADQMRAQLAPNARVVNAPIHNSAVFIAGAAAYLGYPAHVWSHGFDPYLREGKVKDFYEGRIETLPEVHVDYALVGPAEMSTFHPLVVRPSWKAVMTQGSYTLYQLP